MQNLAWPCGPGATAVAAAPLCGAVDCLLLHVLACTAVRGWLEQHLQADVNRSDKPIWGHFGYVPATQLQMSIWPFSAVPDGDDIPAEQGLAMRTQCCSGVF